MNQTDSPARRADRDEAATTSTELPGPGASASQSPACDPKAAIARLGGFLDLYQSLLAKFFGDEAGNRARIALAVEQGDAAALHHAAHSLKGLAAACGATSIAQILAGLEQMGRCGELAQSARAVERLDRAFDQARQDLAGYLVASESS
jgi:HPt (histidine-containing phosphotransfer) domain-containing protein